jgi:hypothetical protein
MSVSTTKIIEPAASVGPPGNRKKERGYRLGPVTPQNTGSCDEQNTVAHSLVAGWILSSITLTRCFYPITRLTGIGRGMG